MCYITKCYRSVSFNRFLFLPLFAVGLFHAARALPVSRNQPVRHPIVLVPGDAGSQIWAKLNRTSGPHFWCDRTTDWFIIWLSLEELTPLIIDCWADNIGLIYDNKTRTTSNIPGVSSKVDGWGNVTSVEYLDPYGYFNLNYFHDIITAAKSWGYTPGKDLRGAPYDFRKAPNEHAEYFQKLQQLIESTYYQNGNVKVITLGHSMGNLMSLYFYQHQPQKWKDKFIQSHISIAGPWAGSAKLMQLFASGYNLNVWPSIVLPAYKLRVFERTMPSSAFLMPNRNVWDPKEILVQTPNKNYTIDDYEQFFNDIGWSTGWQMYLDTKDLVNPKQAPGVEVHCLVGTGVPTPESFVYGKGQFPDTAPTKIFSPDPGDGTVNMQSARVCQGWASHQKQKVFYKEFPKEEHNVILHSADLIEYLRTAVQNATTVTLQALYRRNRNRYRLNRVSLY